MKISKGQRVRIEHAQETDRPATVLDIRPARLADRGHVKAIPRPMNATSSAPSGVLSLFGSPGQGRRLAVVVPLGFPHGRRHRNFLIFPSHRANFPVAGFVRPSSIVEVKVEEYETNRQIALVHRGIRSARRQMNRRHHAPGAAPR